jgi:hypothetical protein
MAKRKKDKRNNNNIQTNTHTKQKNEPHEIYKTPRWNAGDPEG